MDRRKWFKYMSLAGGAAVINPVTLMSAHEDYFHPLDDGSNGLVRLCYNENPYGPSKKMRESIIKSFDNTHMYPFQFINEFAEKLAKKHNVTRDHIVITGGSREGLNATGLTFSEEGGNIVAPYPTYQALMRYAKQFGMHVYDVPLDKDLKNDLNAMEKRITNRTNLVFICNPNNPTGTVLPHDELKSFCEENCGRTVLFVDEVYNDYVTEDHYPSMVSLVKEDLNVVVARTFSKIYGLAGARIGYLIARPDIASRIRLNLQAATNIPAIAAASAALDDKEFHQFSLEKNAEAKKIIYKVCDELSLRYIPSNTNFVFFHSGIHIDKLGAKMKDKGVLVGRPFPPLYDWCRISTGKIEDVHKFASAIKEVYS